MRAISLGVVLACGLGCQGSELYGSESYELGQAGPWELPTETKMLGDEQSTVYDGAPDWNGGSGCATQMRDGTTILRDYIFEWFPEVPEIGGFNCRPNTANTSKTSVHGTGRALDIFIPLSGGEADNELGDPVANWLVENAEYLGVQYIVWDRWSWGAHRSAGEKERSYGGPHPHHDHLHVELTNEAADMLTDFFQNTESPPRVRLCGSVPPEGAIIDNDDPCLQLFGAEQYWRSENAGHGGGLVWTNAYRGDSASNWARWQLNVQAEGRYTLSTFVDPAFGVHREVIYTVTHAEGQSEVIVDQSLESGFVELGTFLFNGDRREQLTVSDHSFSDVDDDQHIAVDALLVEPADEGATLPTEPTGEGGCGCRAGAGQGSQGIALILLAWFALGRRKRSVRS